MRLCTTNTYTHHITLFSRQNLQHAQTMIMLAAWWCRTIAGGCTNFYTAYPRQDRVNHSGGWVPQGVARSRNLRRVEAAVARSNCVDDTLYFYATVAHVAPHATRFPLRLNPPPPHAPTNNACKAPEVRGDRDMIFQFSAPEIEVGKCTTPHCFVDGRAGRSRTSRA